MQIPSQKAKGHKTEGCRFKSVCQQMIFSHEISFKAYLYHNFAAKLVHFESVSYNNALIVSYFSVCVDQY